LSIFEEYEKKMNPPPPPTPAVRREYYIQEKKNENLMKGRSDKMRATHWVWFGSGYSHLKGTDKQAALKLVKHLNTVFELNVF